MRDFTGRAAFVTGGAGGISLSIALALARRGVAVALADIDAGRVEAAAETVRAAGVRALAVTLDVSDFAAWETALDAAEPALGPISILVNGAGIGGGGNIAQDDPARWRRVLEINALGPFHGCRAMLPRMHARGVEAHIVNVASLSGLRSNPGMSSYDASKFALVGMSDSLRQELAGTSIGLSVVYPGMTRTGFVEHSREILEGTTGNKIGAGSGVGNILAAGMDPDKLAERVVRGIEAEEYHIFTHADWKPVIQAVFDDRMAAFGANADPEYSEDISALQARIAQTQKVAKTGAH